MVIVKGEKQIENYTINNHNIIYYIRKINDEITEFEVVDYDESSNMGHAGSLILSMSRRNMNEMFDIANDKGLPIYYTDTDSIHHRFNDIPILISEYKRIYGKELFGSKLGQVSTDFKLNGVKKDVYAESAVYLFPKGYNISLRRDDENGNIIDSGCHTRLKGITTEGIINEAKKYDSGVEKVKSNKDKTYSKFICFQKGIEKTFEILSNHKSIKFVLNPLDKENNKQKVKFVYNKNGGIYSEMNEVCRRLKVKCRNKCKKN
jgi:predicted DNA binding protein